jgi:hypothetical protein
MGVTSFEAIVENGQIRLPVHVRLPEKAKVYVIAPDVESSSLPLRTSPRLLHPEQAEDFRLEIVEESKDAKLSTVPT